MLKSIFSADIPDPTIKKAYLLSVADGLCWAMMFGLAESYFAPFIMSYGASDFQMAMLAATGPAAVAVGQLIGAPLSEFIGSRKKNIVATNAIHATMWILVFWSMFLLKKPFIALIIFFIGTLSNNMGSPGFLSWMNDLYPPHLRGKLWGARNRLIGLVQFSSLALGGISLHYAKKFDHLEIMFGVLFMIAALSRYGSAFAVKQIWEPPLIVRQSNEERFSFRTFIFKKLFTTNFGRFALFSFAMTFSHTILPPLVAPYLLRDLGFTYFEFMVINLVPIIATFLSVSYWGEMADKYGNHRILTLTSLAIPFFALTWMFIQEKYLLIFMQAIGGFVWAGFNLSTANFIFDAVQPKNVARIASYFNTLNNLSMVLGSLLSGFALSLFLSSSQATNLLPGPGGTIRLVFFVSFIFRMITILLFRKNFQEVRPVEKSPPAHYIMVYQPLANVINRISLVAKLNK